MNFSVCDNEKDVVESLIHFLLYLIDHLIEEVREVGGTTHLNIG